jgi:L-asparagine transporter-like permease
MSKPRGFYARNDYPFRLKILVVVDIVWTAQATFVYLLLLLLGVPIKTLYPLQTFNVVFVTTVSIWVLIWNMRVIDGIKRRESEKSMREIQQHA